MEKCSLKTEMQKICMKVETATLIIGIWHLIVACMCIIVAVVSMCFDAKLISKILVPRPTTEWEDFLQWFYDYIGPPSILFFQTLALVFSVLLVVGVIKQRSSFIQAFFIYGVISLIFSIMVNLLYIAIIFVDHQYQLLDTPFGLLILHAVFAMELFVIRKTFRKFDRSRKQCPHPKLCRC